MKKKAVRTNEWKLIVECGGTPAVFNRPDVELYNLKTDPEELKNVADENPEVVKDLQNKLNAWIDRRKLETGKPDPHEYQDITVHTVSLKKGHPVINEEPGKSKEDLLAKRLRNLGYE